MKGLNYWPSVGMIEALDDGLFLSSSDLATRPFISFAGFDRRPYDDQLAL